MAYSCDAFPRDYRERLESETRDWRETLEREQDTRDGSMTDDLT